MTTLRPISIISGDETLLINEAVAEIETVACSQGYNEKHLFDQDNIETWQRFIHEIHARSLFAEKKRLLCRFLNTKISEMAQKSLQEYAACTPKDQILIVIFGKLTPAQQQATWFQTLKKSGQFIQVWPVTLKQFPLWSKQRLQKAGYQLTPNALQLFCDHCEGNLLAAQQGIEKLKLLHQPGIIDESQLLSCLTPAARYSVFDLVNAIWAKQLKKVAAILEALRVEGTEPAIVLWAIARECRKHQLANHISLLHETDQTIKGLKQGSPWLILQQLCFAIAGRPLFISNPSRAQ